MKTPEEFARAINDRKADSNLEVRRQRPKVIIVTMILAVFMMVSAGSGLLRLGIATERVLQVGGSFLAFADALSRDLGIAVLAAATLYACAKRPPWGRIVSVVFAVTFGALFGVILAFPDPHPVFQIAPGAEQAGAYAADVLMAFGIVAYVWSMVMGRKARAFFAGP